MDLLRVVITIINSLKKKRFPTPKPNEINFKETKEKKVRETSEISKQMWQKLRVKQKGKEVGDIYPSWLKLSII